MSDKLFSESEVGEIMRRAAELQEKGSDSGYLPGVSSAEMSRMASEIGIDSKYLEVALQERLTGKSAVSKLDAYPTIEKIYPIELGPNDLDIITEYLKPLPSTNSNGTTSPGLVQVGRTLQGKAACAWGNPDFRVTSRDGRTKVVVTSDKATPAGISCIWILPMIVGIILMGKVSVVAGLAVFAASIVLALLCYPKLVKKSGEMTIQTAEAIDKGIVEYMESRPSVSSTSVAETEQMQQRISE